MCDSRHRLQTAFIELGYWLVIAASVLGFWIFLSWMTQPTCGG